MESPATGVKQFTVKTEDGEWIGAVAEDFAPLVEFAPELRNAAIGARKLLTEIQGRGSTSGLQRVIAQIICNLQNAINGADGIHAVHIPVGFDP